MKNKSFVFLLCSLLIFSCQSEPKSHESPQTSSTQENNWVIVNPNDADGHGPDRGTLEAAYAIAHRFVTSRDVFKDTGKKLVITSCSKSASNPEIFEANYMYQVLGNNGNFYKGIVEIKGDQARFVDNSGEVLGIKTVLANIIKTALGDDKINLTDSSVMGNILTKEHQFMDVYNNIQMTFQLDLSQMDALWDKLSPDASFLDWQNVLKNS